MFGYVHIDKLELKMKDYIKYKGYYCGLCMSLKKKYGNISRFTLNYDMTYLIIILTSLYEPINYCSNRRCITHPHAKQYMVNNEITDYAACLNVLLAYNNLKDDWKDEKRIKSLLLIAILRRAYKRACEDYPEKNRVIVKHLENLKKLEDRKCNNIEEVSNEFGNLLGEIIIYKKDHWENYLRNIGFYLGKYIYILDAFDDIEEDKENNSYNPFLLMEVPDLEDYVCNLLNLNLSFLHNEIDKLPLLKEKAILDNIIYSGIKHKLRKIMRTREENKKKD